MIITVNYEDVYIVKGNTKQVKETLICNESACIYLKNEDGIDTSDIIK